MKTAPGAPIDLQEEFKQVENRFQGGELPSLGAILRNLADTTGAPLDALTVLSQSNDPYRLDTPSNHRNAKWFRDCMERCGLLNRKSPLHNRGIHYAIVSLGDLRLPDGKPYRNDDDCWSFLQNKASKAARWLGYVPFSAVSDARNSEPIIREATEWDEPWPFVGVLGIDPSLFERLPSFKPYAHATIDAPPQPYRLVIFGEKTSLEDVLTPIAEQYNADLYLPSGEISDTLLHRMAKTAAEDGREMVVVVIADCDPAGYQMAVSIGHKLRALADSFFPGLSFRVIAPCLTVEQVKDLGLPSTPLKATELRADGWRSRYGVEQTEIDALATLRPHLLRQIVEEALEPYFDETLADRVALAKAKWQREANAALTASLSGSGFEEARQEALQVVETCRRRLTEVSNRLDRIVDGLALDLPEIQVPDPALPPPPPPLVSSDMPLMEASAILRERKDYAS